MKSKQGINGLFREKTLSLEMHIISSNARKLAMIQLILCFLKRVCGCVFASQQNKSRPYLSIQLATKMPMLLVCPAIML